MLTGDNGILTRAGDAKDDSIVGQEKEQVELAYISAKVKKLGENVDTDDLQGELDISVGDGKAIVYKKDNNILNVYFTETTHNYIVNNGKIDSVDYKLNPVEVTNFANNITLLRGNQGQISLEYTGMVKNITYSSNNISIATVDTGGKVTASSTNTGTSNITITITDYFGNITTRTCIATVNMGIARTNNKDYSSIQNAINSVSDSSGIVIVLTDLTTAQSIAIASGKDITLDMNNKTIDTHTINRSRAFSANVNGTLTVLNGTFYGMFYGVYKNGSGTAIFNSCNIDRIDNAPACVVAGTAVFDSCIIGQSWQKTGNGWTGVVVNGTGDVTVNNCSLYGNGNTFIVWTGTGYFTAMNNNYCTGYEHNVFYAAKPSDTGGISDLYYRTSPTENYGHVSNGGKASL